MRALLGNPSIRTIVACAVLGAVVGVCAAAAEPPNAGPPRGPAAQAAPAAALSPDQTAALWRELAANLNPAMMTSRRLLLGNRDPNGPTCSWIRWQGDTVFMMGDLAGGPGTRVAALYFGPQRGRTPKPDFVFHQKVFKPALEAMLARNQEVFPGAVRLAEQSADLAAAIRAWKECPKDFPVMGLAAQSHWPGWCARNLDESIGRRDLAGCRRWSDELAAATFAVADLHRWLDFLLKDHLAALAFQAQCEPLFDQSDDKYGGGYNPNRNITAFPAGRLGTTGMYNYIEVERQAEFMFRVPGDYFILKTDGTKTVKDDGLADVPAAVWMPPRLRSTFVALRKHLSPDKQAVWDAAAHSPYDRSYMANMLYRAWQADLVSQVATVLERFDKARPHATIPALMGVLCYRGGDAGGAADWGDRFDPRLLDASARLDGDNSQVLLAAQQFTRSVFGTWSNYQTVTTLREALSTRKMDCIRATDMIGSLYRDAGRSGFFIVRWCAGTIGHSLAAAEVEEKGRRQIYIVDGLEDAENLADRWPDACFRGPAWPNGFSGDKADVYAAELYARGLDSYVWVEGYVVRGPKAGTLARASIPYLPHRPPEGVTKVFSGPYPDRGGGQGG
jgi:hypothetical protein